MYIIGFKGVLEWNFGGTWKASVGTRWIINRKCEALGTWMAFGIIKKEICGTERIKAIGYNLVY